MKDIFNIIPILLFLIVGFISLKMAFKCLFSKKILPFHEKASGKLWNEFEDPVKILILALMRLTGIGFLVTSVLLIVFPIYNYFIPNIFYKYSIPVIALIFCTGLFLINYILYKKTKAETPWKGSLIAIIVIIAGMIISFFN